MDDHLRIDTDRVWTVPNVLSMLRLLAIPVFCWLVLVPHADIAGAIVLVATGITDYLDGVIARRTGTVSRLGQLLDPLADRLAVVAALAVFGLRGIVPWWLVAVLVARDLVLALTLPVLTRRGIPALPVHYLGKLATFLLLVAFPLVLFGTGDGMVWDVCRAIGWAFLLWGTALYWWAGILYLDQVVHIARRPSAN